MKVTKENLNLEKGLQREWLITNGLGGFASSTIIGVNTRKYHGLLIAPLTPPARRYLILSKVDESITIGNQSYDLYSNIGDNFISKGFEYQESFEFDCVPTYTYKVKNTTIQKTICMEYGKNTVCIRYKVENGMDYAKLLLAPIINFRDFHSMSTNWNFNLKQNINKTKVKVILNSNSQTPIYMHLSEGKYIEHQNDIFKNMFYIEEQKRGFYPEENHCVPGVFEVKIAPNENKEITFVCSFEDNIDEIDAKTIIEKEKQRKSKIINKTELLDEKIDLSKNGIIPEKSSKILAKSKINSSNNILFDDSIEKKSAKSNINLSKNDILSDDNIEKTRKELLKALINSSDDFIAYRPSFRLHTIIAGYHWFLDWGRDSLISLEGLLLKTKRYDIAKEILETMMRDIKYGLVPNGYSGFDNRPLYNSVDASLLLIEQIKKYLTYTDDYDYVEEIYPKLENIIENYITGIDVDNNNIYLDTDFLLVSGTENTQNTWMDAKIGNYAVTPRNGKAVEVNSMWYNALMIMSELSLRFGKIIQSRKYKQLAKKCKMSFEEKFYNKKRKCLYDVLGDSKIRPNQLFALSLTYPIIDPSSDIAKEILSTVEKKLLNDYGLKTLAKGEDNYVEIYEGDPKKRDMSYHQGITWVWLLGVYYDTLKNIEKATKKKKEKQELEEKLKKFKINTIKVFSKEINERGCIGSISEMYDSAKPFEPKGAVAQAWSVAEIIRMIT